MDFVPFKNPEEEVKALGDGRLQIAGVNTGNIPTAVNQYGFVPFCSLANDKGNREISDADYRPGR